MFGYIKDNLSDILKSLDFEHPDSLNYLIGNKFNVCENSFFVINEHLYYELDLCLLIPINAIQFD